ncbi:hypothetical protein [Vibrio penaeicida]|uniref:hypothetical protein n=1 Tax=Vibrio penaeicida TaxID=104609 RepID=UPI00352BAF4B
MTCSCRRFQQGFPCTFRLCFHAFHKFKKRTGGWLYFTISQHQIWRSGYQQNASNEHGGSFIQFTYLYRENSQRLIYQDNLTKSLRLSLNHG